MKVCIRAAGLIKSGPERTLVDAYLGRAQNLGRGLGIPELTESAVDVRSCKSRADETRVILSSVKPTDKLIILDERGKSLTSREMARQLANWRDEGVSQLILAIGGADGFEPSALPSHVTRWQLGKLTWPHKLVRVMLAEQIYRSLSILAKTPYHRD